jgi:hypothetical protein
MGINAQLRDESGNVLGEVLDPEMVLSGASLSSNLSGTRLLRYLQPYGDTVFNQAQAVDLGLDVREIIRASEGKPLGSLLKSIEPLVDRLATETHVYLWFIGD